MLILHLIDWRHLVIICLMFTHVDNKRHLQNQHTYGYMTGCILCKTLNTTYLQPSELLQISTITYPTNKCFYHSCGILVEC